MDCSRVFVRGLPPNLSAEDFRTHFSKQFKPTDTKIIPHRRIGYVGFKSSEDATKAVKYYNKSFVRLSRIGVELARSVEELRLPRNASHPTDSEKRSHESTNSKIGTPLKTRAVKQREEPHKVEDQTKLNEFLKAMQPSSRSRVWEDQAAIGTQKAAEPISNVSNVHAVDDRADEAYEPVPKRQKKSHEISPRIYQSDQPVQSEKELNSDSAINSRTEEAEAAQSSLDPVAAQSDVDWIRSRTSRLLGLVDESDDQVPIALTDEDHMPEITRDKLSEQLEPGNASDENAQIGKNTREDDTATEGVPSSGVQEDAMANDRLFLRNLTYSTTENDLRELFMSGNYGAIEELHLPIDSRTGNNKGFAHVQFVKSEGAAQALSDLDQKPFQGRLLHVLPANAKKENNLDDFAISKLPLKKQQQIRRKAQATTSTFNWNSLYMNSDAIMSSISDRLGVPKTDLVDPTSSDAAVKQAHAETHIIQETKSYFTAHGVDLDAFKDKARGDTAILIKNFAYGTTLEELRKLSEPHGHIHRLLMPPSGTIAIVEFGQPDHARAAFTNLAYRKFKDSILFLEKAPKDLFSITTAHQDMKSSNNSGAKVPADEVLQTDGPPKPIDTSTLFVRNLNFITTTERLREVFQPLDGFLSARVKTKADPKKPGQLLSMGFGFLEFLTKDYALAALQAMDGYKLDGHNLLVRASHRAVDAAEERRKEDHAKKKAGRKTKIIIKNLPFQVSRKDIRSLFGAYGQLRSVRVPKKFDSSTRGFAFADFVTAREAENAMDALRDTHLLGRRLVLEFAAEDAIEPEEEIEKMQQKVGRQADKVALQRLTGSTRKKFNVEGVEELDQG